MNNKINTEGVLLRQVINSDMPVIEKWLNKEHIKQWYGEPREWIDEINNISGEYDWQNHYIVEYENCPFGFCQYYDCSKTPKGFEWDNEPLGTFGIDYLIGEEAFLKKGLGSVLIQNLIKLIVQREDPIQIIADPVKDNIKSIKLLEKNGFVLDNATGLYKLKIENVII